MNHLLKQFNGRRLLPARKLKLPLKLIGDRYVNSVVNGKCIASKNKIVKLFDELSYKEITTYHTPSDYYGLHGFSENGFLLSDNRGTLYTFEYDCADPSSNIDGVGIFFLKGESHWIGDSYSLHMYSSEGVNRNRIRGDKYICLFNWSNKELVWKVKPDNFMFGYALSSDKLVCQMGFEDGSVQCLNLVTGEILWKKSPLEIVEYSEEEKEKYNRWQKAIKGSPRIYNDLVIVGMPFSRLVALDLNTGNKVWEHMLSWREYREPLHCNISRPYELAVTESGKVYRLESVDVVCGYDKHCHRLFLIELEAASGRLLQRLEVKAPEGDLQTHIIDPFEKDISFGEERDCDVTKTHYLTSFEGGLIMAINLKTGIVDWHTTLPTGTPTSTFFVLNNRFYISTGMSSYIFEGEGGYIPD